ncbi:hypothetical protein [Bosea sp. FBZP-16]|uniref:hypothetical protein n=1 Tax=Bosea sp. FBZP-16 TaxID=2065382 RepID=UPI000C313DB6|nr:hypothetical protein [Bosea sp. FBZP-16]
MMLVRLDKATMADMKRSVRKLFPRAGHAHALEALARGLGANTFNDLRAYARDYGGILWDGDDKRAVQFLAERGTHSEPGCLAHMLAVHEAGQETVLLKSEGVTAAILSITQEGIAVGRAIGLQSLD